MQLRKYKQNLRIQGSDVWCYNSNIARISGQFLEVLNKFKKYSSTTTKHYRYVSAELNLLIKFVDTFTTKGLT